MSEISSQQAEKQYIDSMLGVLTDAADAHAENINDQQSVLPERVTDVAVQPAEATKTTIETTEAEAATADEDSSLENLHQVIVVAGLKLAVPVTAISRVEPGNLSGIDGDTLLTMDGRFTVVDIARFIDAQNTTDPVEHYLLIGSHGYAIACGELLSMEAIMPETVCKRSENSNRIWLAGTVAAKSIAVLDLDGISALLN